MSKIALTPEQKNEFHVNGYVIARNYYTHEEITLIQNKAFNDESLYKRAWEKKDSSGTVSKVCIWQELDDGLYSMFSRGKRLVDSVEALLGEEVYHTSTKIMMKEPFVGGAWEWHQDFGYWHNDNYYLYPKLISCMLAINKANIENGCLQVLKGSHHIGRLNHTKTGDQKGAELHFVEEALKNHELINVELEPGDVLFFHSNLLHKSNQNKSAEPRWSMICAYNALSNKSIKDNEAIYYPLRKVDDDAILKLNCK